MSECYLAIKASLKKNDNSDMCKRDKESGESNCTVADGGDSCEEGRKEERRRRRRRRAGCPPLSSQQKQANESGRSRLTHRAGGRMCSRGRGAWGVGVGVLYVCSTGLCLWVCVCALLSSDARFLLLEPLVWAPVPLQLTQARVLAAPCWLLFGT